MKIIVGLGNPESKYDLTRHNAGFMAIDHFLKGLSGITCQGRFKAKICEIHFGRTKVFFVKPQTYMNNSGQSVADICGFYKARPNQDLLVVHDEKDLPFGTVRLSRNSSSAGHNGVKSIIDSLKSQEFSRLRIGIESRGENNPLPTEAFVLQNFSPEEQNRLPGVLREAAEIITAFVNDDK